MVDKDKANTVLARVIVRVDIPKAENQVALELHSKISELVKGIPGATVEVTLLPATETR